MKLLSRQQVMDKFELYFLAATTDTPPVADDVDAVANREWLWQRPFTTLELQHPLKERSPFKLSPEDQLGFRGVGMRVAGERFEALKKELGNPADYSEVL